MIVALCVWGNEILNVSWKEERVLYLRRQAPFTFIRCSDMSVLRNVIWEYLLDCLLGGVLDSKISSENRPKITHFSRKFILTSKTLVEGFYIKKQHCFASFWNYCNFMHYSCIYFLTEDTEKLNTSLKVSLTEYLTNFPKNCLCFT